MGPLYIPLCFIGKGVHASDSCRRFQAGNSKGLSYYTSLLLTTRERARFENRPLSSAMLTETKMYSGWSLSFPLWSSQNKRNHNTHVQTMSVSDLSPSSWYKFHAWVTFYPVEYIKLAIPPRMNWLWNNYLSSEIFSLFLLILFLCVWIPMCRKLGRKLLLGLEDEWLIVLCFSNYFKKIPRYFFI